MTVFQTNLSSLEAADVSRPMNPAFNDGDMNWKYTELSANHGLTLANSDQLVAFTLPKGVRPMLLKVEHGAFGASVVLDVGIDGALQAYETGLDVSAAGASLTGCDVSSPTTDVTTVVAMLRGANPADDQRLAIAVGYVGAN